MSGWISERRARFLLVRFSCESSLTSAWRWASCAGLWPWAHFSGPVRQVCSGARSQTAVLRKGCLWWYTVMVGVVQGGGGWAWRLWLSLWITVIHNESFCLLICKEEEVATKGRELPPRGAEELPGGGLGAPYHAHTEAAGRMPEAPWADWEVSFKGSIFVRKKIVLCLNSSNAHNWMFNKQLIIRREKVNLCIGTMLNVS